MNVNSCELRRERGNTSSVTLRVTASRGSVRGGCVSELGFLRSGDLCSPAKRRDVTRGAGGHIGPPLRGTFVWFISEEHEGGMNPAPTIFKQIDFIYCCLQPNKRNMHAVMKHMYARSIPPNTLNRHPPRECPLASAAWAVIQYIHQPQPNQTGRAWPWQISTAFF